MKSFFALVLFALCSAQAQTNLPPLPIPLTPEQDARLVATGELPAHVAVPGDGRLIAYNFHNAPLFTLTDYFTELTGVRVEGASNSVAEFTLKSDEKVSVPEFLAIFSNELKRLDITLEPVTTGVVRVHDAHAWKAPSAPRPSYAERRQQRLAATGTSTNPPPRPRYTGEALKKHLEDYNAEVQRRGLPPLPIPLTPEEDAELVRQGILPPIDNCATNAPAKVPMTGKP